MFYNGIALNFERKGKNEHETPFNPSISLAADNCRAHRPFLGNMVFYRRICADSTINKNAGGLDFGTALSNFPMVGHRLRTASVIFIYSPHSHREKQNGSNE